MYDYDLFVIGAGSGGVRASRIASSLGAKVAVAEEYRVGGTCVIRGCVPKKLMVYASHFADDFEQAAGFGWSVGDTSFDWKALIARKDAEIDRLNGLYIQTLTNAGVDIIEGRATFVDDHTVEVAGRRYTAEKILIAVGGTPWKPQHDGYEHCITSNEVFHLTEQPKRILVVGAGYIAVEFAGIFHGLGTETTLVYRGDKVLRGFDEELRDRLTHEMTDKGINFLFENNITKIEKRETGLLVHFDHAAAQEFDQVLVATGRRPHTEGLGLENTDVDISTNGAIHVDEFSRTNVSHIFAVGDVTDRIQLTPVAIKEGHAFALTEFGHNPVSAEHDHVASAVFCQPPIASVGLTEQQAAAKYKRVGVYKSDFKPMRHTLGNSNERALTKLLVDMDSDRVVGAHMIGVEAAEIIQGIAIAVKHGLTKAQFDSTVAIHPSSAEEFVLMPTPKYILGDE